MKTEYRVFTGLALFLLTAATVYGTWTGMGWAGAPTHRGIEPIGLVALTLSGLLCLMCGGYFWFVSRRIDPRPEDRLDGEIVEGVGDMGFFSPGSYWPFGVALAAFIAATGIALGVAWLAAVGIVAVLVSASGLLFEYYTGARHDAEHS